MPYHLYLNNSYVSKGDHKIQFDDHLEQIVDCIDIQDALLEALEQLSGVDEDETWLVFLEHHEITLSMIRTLTKTDLDWEDNIRIKDDLGNKWVFATLEKQK